MLNAFRHHRGGHRLVAAGARSGLVCSTPFGITEVGIRPAPATPRPAYVLNAFRHHRGGHKPVFDLFNVNNWCSTPFGITEVGMATTIVAAVAGKRCSTPFGITEVGIPRSDHPKLLYGVLNAFRHHRGGHSLASPSCSTGIGAQRLSASQRWALAASRSRKLWRSSAQRLSASQRWAL